MHKNVKLTKEIVYEILDTTGKNPEKPRKTSKQWAEELGLHIRTIDAVRMRKNWKHVQYP